MRKVGIELPPIQADLLGLIHRTDEQTYANGQQLNVGQRNAYVAGYHQTLVQHPIQDVEQVGCSRDGRYTFHEGFDKTGKRNRRGPFSNRKGAACSTSRLDTIAYPSGVECRVSIKHSQSHTKRHYLQNPGALVCLDAAGLPETGAVFNFLATAFGMYINGS